MTHGHISYSESAKDARIYQLNLSLKTLEKSFDDGLAHADEYLRQRTKIVSKMLKLQK